MILMNHVIVTMMVIIKSMTTMIITIPVNKIRRADRMAIQGTPGFAQFHTLPQVIPGQMMMMMMVVKMMMMVVKMMAMVLKMMAMVLKVMMMMMLTSHRGLCCYEEHTVHLSNQLLQRSILSDRKPEHDHDDNDHDDNDHDDG